MLCGLIHIWYGKNLFDITEIHNTFIIICLTYYKQYLVKFMICLETTLRIQWGPHCHAATNAVKTLLLSYKCVYRL